MAWPRRRGSRRNSGELKCAARAYQARSASHGREKWFAGEAEELWWWCWSGQARAGVSNGDGGGGEELAAALAVKKEARSEMGALGGSGR